MILYTYTDMFAAQTKSLCGCGRIYGQLENLN